MELYLFTGVAQDKVLVRAKSLRRAVELVRANLPEYDHQASSWIAKRLTPVDQNEGVTFLTF